MTETFEDDVKIPGTGKGENNFVPIFSIITIVFNGERFLEKTIKSVINQEFKSFEYIIIDGGSTDNTLNIIRQYENYISFWISEPDKGISDAFNKGIKKAKGQLIGIINSDDWYEPDTLTNVYKHLNDADIIYGNLQYWIDNEKEYLFHPRHHFLQKEMTLSHPSVFIKKEVYEKYGGYDLNFKLAMDYEALLRYYTHGVSFKYVGSTLANMNKDGVSDRKWQQAYYEVMRAKLKNNNNSLQPYLYYCYQLLRTYSTKALNYLGMDFIVRWYRKKYSIIKKNKE